MYNSKIIATFFVIIFLCNYAHPDTAYLESEWNETIHPVISYHAELDASFLSKWWDINYPLLYASGATTGPWGGRVGKLLVNNRQIALRNLVQEFISLLDFDYSMHNPNSIYINQASIAHGPLVITEPGVVCHLQESITAARGKPAIIVAADNVIINLNKFTLRGYGKGADGIIVKGGVKWVTICNGKIRDAGAHGIHTRAQTDEVNLIELDIQGSLEMGILVNSNRMLVLDCVTTYNNEAGFRAESGKERLLINCLSHSNGTLTKKRMRSL